MRKKGLRLFSATFGLAVAWFVFAWVTHGRIPLGIGAESFPSSFQNVPPDPVLPPDGLLALFGVMVMVSLVMMLVGLNGKKGNFGWR